MENTKKRQKYKSNRNINLSGEFIQKLQKICMFSDSSAVYKRKSNKLLIHNQNRFYQSINQIENRSKYYFQKQLRFLGFKRRQKESVIIYKWKGRVDFNIVQQINQINQTLSAQIDERKNITQFITKKKDDVDKMLENIIFKYLTTDKTQNDLNKIYQSMQNTIYSIKKIMEHVHTQTLNSAQNIQKIYGQQLRIYRNLIYHQKDQKAQGSQ